MSQLITTIPIGLIVVDYIQLLGVSSDAENRNQELDKMARSLSVMSKAFNIPIVVISQLSRHLESRTDKRPRLSDLRRTISNLDHYADVVCFIYRDEVYSQSEGNPKKGTAELIVRKNRNGPTSTTILSFSDKFIEFDSLSS